jgi:peptidoglycan/xylan/chitin deacetylase (PgdA/CDA1 family)
MEQAAALVYGVDVPHGRAGQETYSESGLLACGSAEIPPMQAKASLRNLPSQIIWRMPMRFRIANLLGSSYALRCVLFHHIAAEDSPFTKGLGITLGVEDFDAKMRFLAEHYSPMSLEDVLALPTGKTLPRRPVLVTFDDAYASIAEVAGPICRKYGIPATFFVNASLVGNQDLGLDNLVCYSVNRFGLEPVRKAARQVSANPALQILSLTHFFGAFLPNLSLQSRREFRDALELTAGFRSTDLAREAKLYVSADQLRSLVSQGFSIGNHTYTHVNCRVLSGDDFDQEIFANQRVLEAIVNRKVRAFSVPYGSSADVTRELLTQLRQSGHEALFLVESLANTAATDYFHLYRVSVTARSDANFFGELEIQPRLRSIRNRLFRQRAKTFQ